jgi:thioester reductase-like protein
LVRSRRSFPASQRIEAVMSEWERQDARIYPRPIVLEADVRQPNCGLSDQQRQWITENCECFVHSAASMMFRADKHGEPHATNVEGMKNVLGLSRECGIRNFHHVSTAYICGLREGRILEDEVDLGQQNGNVYEVSKLAAEKLLRAADFLECTTIYRPASVVGDSRTGFTTSSHGFYLPLQLAYSMADRVPAELMGEQLLALLGLRGDEGKNLVPVDWLSAAIAYLVTHPEHHGRTYHLTNPRPVTVRLIQNVIREAVQTHCAERLAAAPTAEQLESYQELFKDFMEVYRSHWRDDPVFDRAHADAALGHLPCPELDHERMLRIASYPVEHKFVLNGARAVEVAFAAEQHLRQLVRAAPGEMAAEGAAKIGSGSKSAGAETVGIEVTGSGGGQWRLTLQGEQVVRVDLGSGNDDLARYYLSSRVFSSLVERRSSVEESLRAGRIVIEGANGNVHRYVRMLQRIVCPA